VDHSKRLGLFRQLRTGSTLPVDGWLIMPINTFSGIYEHVKEQRLSSGLFLLNLKTKQKYAWDRFYFYTSLKLNKTMLGPGFIFKKIETEETMLEVVGFIFTQA
jgi:hypothetical protein